MAAVWLDSSTYPSIRAAIAPDMDMAALPDAVLALPIYTGVSELAIKGLDPDWAAHNVDADSFAILQIAAIYWCASMVIPTLPFINRESFGQRDYEYFSTSMTPAQLRAILRARASELVAVVVNGNPAEILPFFFGVAAGTRSRDFSDARLFTLPPASTLLGVE